MKEEEEVNQNHPGPQPQHPLPLWVVLWMGRSLSGSEYAGVLVLKQIYYEYSPVLAPVQN